MAKVIKQEPGAAAAAAAAGAPAAAGRELTQIADTRRAPVIERQTYEARASAQQIRDRAQAQAAEIVGRAQAEADAKLTAARGEAERLARAAHQEGLLAGRNEGAAQLAAMIAQASVRLQAAEAALVPQLAALATHIARKVLGRELEFGPELVVELVRQALAEKARQRREVTLRVHPDDLAVLREARGQLVEVLSRSKEIGILEDPKVQRFGVVIETEAGTIDAQLDTQLAAFERVLLQAG